LLPGKERVLNPLIHNSKDFWTGVIYIVFGSAVVILSRSYDMGTAMKMGPAYFPTLLSALLIAIGVISFVRSFIKPGSGMGKAALKGLILITAAIVLFGFIVHGAGLVIALPILVVVSSWASSRFHWKYALTLAAGLTVFCILVFLKGLGVPLPILGHWFGY
jgi:hypothetical protein